jgi:hypothetical protein
MPGKIWTRADSGSIESRVETRGRSSGRPEDFALADSLDQAIDAAFDAAEELRRAHDRSDVPSRFTENWAVGRALAESGLLDHSALHGEAPDFVYRVMASKARALARSDGTEAASWTQLRPALSENPPNREGGRKGHDHWSMCVWLAEQDYDDAVTTFGGHIRNAWQMLERPALSPLVFRRAFRSWLSGLTPSVAAHLTDTKTFPELMKAFRERWPSRGLRSALQPIHYKEGELRSEIDRVANDAGFLNS